MQSFTSSYQVRQMISHEISVYSQVAVRQQYCCRCGVIQQRFAVHSINRGTSASAHQHSQHSDFGKHPPFVQREDDQVYRDREARVKIHFNVSTASIDNIHTGQEKYKLDSRHQTRHRNHGAGTVHLDSMQQPGSSGSAATPTSTSSLPIYERGSHYSCSSSGTTSSRQETRRQADGNSIEETYGAISTITR